MLHFISLCLAAGLASAFGDPAPPKFSNVFSVRVDLTVLDRKVLVPQHVWLDGTLSKIRLDQYGTMTQQSIALASKTNPNNEYIKVYSITTEEEVNKRVCSIDYFDDPRGVYRENMLPDLTRHYKFIGKERIHGEEAEQWQQTELGLKYTVWLTYKELQGNRQPVPLRFEKILYIPQFGTIFIHHVRDYYNYSTSAIDPGIFDIHKGLNCNKTKPETQPDDTWLENDESPNSHDEFALFKASYSRQYESQEEHDMRQQIFEKNLKIIAEHNRGGHRFQLGVNHFTDRTETELAMLRGRKLSDAPSQGLPFPYSDKEIEALSAELPEQFDWRHYGAVTPVKNQASCGSCWAFGAVGAVEGALYLHSNGTSLLRLSEQALVDCSWGFNNSGCDGGWEESAFGWIKKHGIPTFADYGGYLAENGYCRIANVSTATSISSFTKIKQDEKALKLAIVKHGPIAVSICATPTIGMYRSGVFRDPTCSQDRLNHVVLVVGYGVLDGQQYWLVKNSWGEEWGVGGYVLMATEGNMCGVQTDAHYVSI